MDAKSEVVLRQQHLYNGTILLVNPPQDQLTQQLAPCQVHLWTWNFADYQYFLQAGYQATFDILPPQHHFQHAIIFVPKSREQLDYILAQCSSLLGTGQNITLVGEKKAGIERAAKQLQPFGKAVKIDSARHCQLWTLQIQHTVTTQNLTAWTKTYTLNIDKTILEICALPGVFSQDHLDIGTEQLLPFLAHVKHGKILDFGCGAGVISSILASQNATQQIVAVDIDAFALKSTELTFARNGLSSQLQTQAIADINDISIEFDAIVSNPPFHQGIKTNYQASENLCRYAAKHLKTKGELWIVANRFLNYPPLIEQSFGHCKIKADTNGFKVLFACL